MPVYEGMIEVTIGPDVDEQAAYVILRDIAKAIKKVGKVSDIRLFIKPRDWAEVNM